MGALIIDHDSGLSGVAIQTAEWLSDSSHVSSQQVVVCGSSVKRQGSTQLIQHVRVKRYQLMVWTLMVLTLLVGRCLTDDWWIPVFLKYSNIDQRVCDAHSWVNTRSKTRPNSQQLHSWRSATPWTPVNWIGVRVFLAASEDLWNYNCFKKLGLFWYCVPDIVNIGLGFWPNIFLTLTDQSTDYAPCKKLKITEFCEILDTGWSQICLDSVYLATTSIILCFNKHWLSQVHLENGR